MRPRYKVSQGGVELIERFEGFRAKAARLTDGRWTIGYGHTRSAREGAEVSPDDARILLRYFDLPPVEEAIHALVSTPLTQNQYDALVAFVFNVGTEAFAESDVLKRLNEGRLTEAACALDLWRKAEISGDPVVLDALIRRRAAEKTLFLTPEDGFAPAPSPLVRPELDARAAEGLPKRRPVELEAPLSGETAEVRLVAPFEVEPPLEAPTAFTLAPVPSEAAPAAAEGPEEAPAAWTAEPVVEPAVAEPVAEETPTAWTTAAEPAVAEPVAEEAPTAWTAPDEPALAEPVAEEAPTAWTAPIEPPAAEPVAEEAPTAQTAPAELATAEPVAEEAPTAWTAPAVAETVVEEVPTAWTVPAEQAAAAPVAEAAPTAWTSPAEPDAAEAAIEEAPTAWTAEIAAEGDAVAQPSAATAWSAVLGAPEAAATPTAEEAPTAWTVEPVEEEAPAPAEPAPANDGPAAHAARRLSPIEIVLAPANAPEPEPEPAPVAAEAPPVPEPGMRAIPAAERPIERPFYSSYGPMAFAVRPPRPSPVEAPQAGGAAAAPAAEAEPAQAAAEPEPEPEPALAPVAAEREPEPIQTIPPAPYGEPVLQPARTLSEMAPAPVVTADRATPQPLVLTSPPSDWEERRRPSPAMTATLAAEADELETPLFDEGWDGASALSSRIVRHEPVPELEEEGRAGRRVGATGPYVLLGLIGFVAFGGALFAFWRGRAPGADMGDPTILAWALALIGAACVGISVYFLLKRLGGAED